jgi:hypothetical protein
MRRRFRSPCPTLSIGSVRVPFGPEVTMKGSDKPKKLQKKVAQKTLKEKRSEKKAAPKKYGST